ncbi:MAG TPA: SgcJ/EcaC family oxidoreductase [Candidatus Acidoferrales bacterium]|nr:SgcJ/EcaC family oxidoreductase [Candidatus Acidoferrales bacterium]
MLALSVPAAIARLAAPALLGAMVLCLGAVHAAPNDDAAVRKVVNAFPDAWNRHAMQAFGALFTADADFVNVTGTHWHGRTAIQLNHAFVHGTIPAASPGVALPKAAYGIFKTSILQFTQVDVRFLRNDVAVAEVQTELLGDARTKNPRRTFLLVVLTEEAGHWLIAVAQNTEINRPPELNR